jgi:Family of unknown function (DUF5906)
MSEPKIMPDEVEDENPPTLEEAKANKDYIADVDKYAREVFQFEQAVHNQEIYPYFEDILRKLEPRSNYKLGAEFIYKLSIARRWGGFYDESKKVRDLIWQIKAYIKEEDWTILEEEAQIIAKVNGKEHFERWREQFGVGKEAPPAADISLPSANPEPRPDYEPELSQLTALKNQLRTLKSWTSIVLLMNKHYAFITIDKPYVIQELGDEIKLITTETFTKQFNNCKISFDPTEAKKFTNVAIYWLGSTGMRDVDKFVFDPQHKYDPASPIFNKWRYFKTSPIKGDCSLVLNYIRDDICNKDDLKYKWLMSWCAHMFQRPWEKPEIAVAIFGPKGIGKSILFWMLRTLMDGKLRAGEANKYYHKVSKSKGLFPRFNVHLEENILLVSEEISFVRDKEIVGPLTDFLTSDTVSVEIKNGPVRDVPSYSRVGITLNDEHIVPASPDERRYAVFKASAAHQGNKPYYKAIINQFNSMGAEALMYELMHWDISEFDIRQHPDTSELGDQKVESLTGVKRWAYVVAEEGRLPLFHKFIKDGYYDAGGVFIKGEVQQRLLPDWSCRVITKRLFDHYCNFEKDPVIRRRIDITAFGKQLRSIFPTIDKERKIPNRAEYNFKTHSGSLDAYVLPSLKVFRENVEKAIGSTIAWESDSSEWEDDIELTNLGSF